MLGGTLILLVFGELAYEILIGYGFGGSLLALFMRVGGGIYTKAADVGADLVGKVEQSMAEDDPRNAATIADNVGDNVGDCAGMAADVFESYSVTMVAAVMLGYAAFGYKGMIFPLLVQAVGVISSMISTSLVGRGMTTGTSSGGDALDQLRLLALGRDQHGRLPRARRDLPSVRRRLHRRTRHRQGDVPGAVRQRPISATDLGLELTPARTSHGEVEMLRELRNGPDRNCAETR